MSVGKISTNISKSSFDGYQKDWSEQGIEKEISSWRVDMSLMILEDKPIPVVLARSIDTSNPAPVTAYVERNVYSEEGRNIIIPAGSRLIGDYSSSGSSGGDEPETSSATRQNISWKRLIRPDGSMFRFDGTSADAMGRAGVLAYVDKQLIRRYSGALLSALGSAYINVLFTTDKSSQVEGNESGRQQAMSDARDDFNEKSKEVFRQMMQDQMSDVSTIVYIPAGTRMIVFPNKDLWLRTVENDNDASSSKEKPVVFIDDKRVDEENKKKKVRGNSVPEGYDDVVYQEDGAEEEGGRKARPLISDNNTKKNNKNNYGGSGNYIPPVTVDPVAPPPSYDSGNYGGDDELSEDSSSDNATPQLF